MCDVVLLQNTDLVSDLEAAILQLQSKCEKLHSTSNHLMEEHSKKQTHIDVSKQLCEIRQHLLPLFT